jgi:arylsulfatase A-like enzyme
MNNRGDLNPQIPTLTQELQKLGYHTSLIGKEHFFEGFVDLTKAELYSKEYFGFDYMWPVAGKSMVAGLYDFPECADDAWTAYLKDKGFLDTYRNDVMERMEKRRNGTCEAAPSPLPQEHHVDYRIYRETISFLEEYSKNQSKDKPFFLWSSFCGPHFPFDPQKKYFERYHAEDMPIPPGCPEHQIEHFQKYLAAYCAMIEEIDEYIGDIIDTLEQQGLRDNTLIVFLSDHGDMVGDFGLFAKSFPFEGSVHVPFIASCPGLIKPGIYHEAIEITDVVATFLEAAGGQNVRDHLSESPSQSLLGHWQGETLQRRYAFSENGYQFQSPFELLTDGTWKYIFYSFSGKESLYNLVEDPFEQQDIAGSNQDKIMQFRHLLLRRKASTPPQNPPEWVYQKINDTDEPNPNRCHHGGLKEYPNEGLINIE